MKNFNDDEFNGEESGDDFLGRWEEFHRMMNNRRDTNKFRRDLEELIRLISQKPGGLPIDFKFTQLNNETRNDLGIPKDEMNIENGEDENGKWETKDWTSPDGSIQFVSFSRSSSPEDLHYDGLSEEWRTKLRNRNRNKPNNTERSKKIKLAQLDKALKYMVEQEKYEKAAELKKMIDDLNNEKKDENK